MNSTGTNTNSNPQNIRPDILERKKNHFQIFKRTNYFVDNDVTFRNGSQSRSGLNLTLWSWMSALIDTLVLISVSCFGLIIFSFLLKTQARDFFKILSIEPNLREMFISSFLFSFWVYLVMMRVFMGASLGEWSCQLRLGQPIQRINPTYVFRVVARTTLLLATGVIVFPVLSLIFKRDILGEITGIKLYSLT